MSWLWGSCLFVRQEDFRHVSSPFQLPTHRRHKRTLCRRAGNRKGTKAHRAENDVVPGKEGRRTRDLAEGSPSSRILRNVEMGKAREERIEERRFSGGERVFPGCTSTLRKTAQSLLAGRGEPRHCRMRSGLVAFCEDAAVTSEFLHFAPQLFLVTEDPSERLEAEEACLARQEAVPRRCDRRRALAKNCLRKRKKAKRSDQELTYTR